MNTLTRVYSQWIQQYDITIEFQMNNRIVSSNNLILKKYEFVINFKRVRKRIFLRRLFDL